MKKKIIIVGAGPGGLTAGMLLANRGFNVTIYEKDGQVGGRNQELRLGDYVFDTGPTFLMMKFVLDDIFRLVGRKSEDYMDFVKLDPMYRLSFKDFEIDVSSDHKKLKKEIKRVFPGYEKGVDKFLKEEGTRYRYMMPCLQKDYTHFTALARPIFLRLLAHLPLRESLFHVLNKYFRKEDLTLAFTFQSKYLGMSPWECPGGFAIIPFVEHNFGIYHVRGGLSEISKAMAKVFEEEGGAIKLKSPVKKLMVESGKVRGVELESGKKDLADAVVINADFAYSMTNLLKPDEIRKWSPKNLEKKKFSCSGFLMYLGVDKIYDQPHHTIIFARDYRKNVEDIFNNKQLSEDISLYVRNSSINDDRVAPKGKSNVYVLVPIANNRSGIDWEKEAPRLRELVLDIIEKRTAMKDIRDHIVEEKIIAPTQWEKEYNVYKGAIFNLAHSLDQMLYFRPHNQFEELKNCYLVGGGTHPGSGLPTIYDSGRITAELITKKFP